MARRGGSATPDQRLRNGGDSPAVSPPEEDEAGTARSAGRVAAARDRLVRGVLSPFNAILITRRNLEEVLEDAVRRGRMTRGDAQDMIQTMLTRGARVTEDLLGDIERILGSSEGLEPGDDTRPSASAGGLPISGYDDLSAPQVQERLDDLSRPQLRRLRDYEQRNANRKTVLERIDRKLR